MQAYGTSFHQDSFVLDGTLFGIGDPFLDADSPLRRDTNPAPNLNPASVTFNLPLRPHTRRVRLTQRSEAVYITPTTRGIGVWTDDGMMIYEDESNKENRPPMHPSGLYQPGYSHPVNEEDKENEAPCEICAHIEQDFTIFEDATATPRAPLQDITPTLYPDVFMTPNAYETYQSGDLHGYIAHQGPVHAPAGIYGQRAVLTTIQEAHGYCEECDQMSESDSSTIRLDDIMEGYGTTNTEDYGQATELFMMHPADEVETFVPSPAHLFSLWDEDDEDDEDENMEDVDFVNPPPGAENISQ